MARVKNTGEHEYTSARITVPAGEVAEVDADHAAYLISGDCPGSFVEVKDEAKPAPQTAAKDKK